MGYVHHRYVVGTPYRLAESFLEARGILELAIGQCLHEHIRFLQCEPFVDSARLVSCRGIFGTTCVCSTREATRGPRRLSWESYPSRGPILR